MKRIFLVIGFVCFFVAFSFNFVDQGFAQQDSQLAGEVEKFTEKDQLSLEKAIEEERWETAVFYREKQQRYYCNRFNEIEAEIEFLEGFVSKKDVDPILVPVINIKVDQLRQLLMKARNLVDATEEKVEELKEKVMAQKRSSLKAI